MEELIRFNKDAAASTEMQEEIKAIGNDQNKIVTYANSKGYLFTLADVQNALLKDGELSEDQLDNVAGGTCIATGIANAGFNMIFIF